MRANKKTDAHSDLLRLKNQGLDIDRTSVKRIISESRRVVNEESSFKSLPWRIKPYNCLAGVPADTHATEGCFNMMCKNEKSGAFAPPNTARVRRIPIPRPLLTMAVGSPHPLIIVCYMAGMLSMAKILASALAFDNLSAG